MQRQTTLRPSQVLMVVSILLLSTIGLSGCTFTSTSGKSVFVYPRQPIYQMPERVKLENVSGVEMAKLSPEARAVIESNFQKAVTNIMQLEAIIETHNAYAKSMNDSSELYGNGVTSGK